MSSLLQKTNSSGNSSTKPAYFQGELCCYSSCFLIWNTFIFSEQLQIFYEIFFTLHIFILCRGQKDLGPTEKQSTEEAGKVKHTAYLFNKKMCLTAFPGMPGMM